MQCNGKFLQLTTGFECLMGGCIAMVGYSERFSLFDMDKILRSVGAERIDEHASRKLREFLEDSAKEIAFNAKILARHAGRKYVLKADIMLAAQQLMS